MLLKYHSMYSTAASRGSSYLSRGRAAAGDQGEIGRYALTARWPLGTVRWYWKDTATPTLRPWPGCPEARPGGLPASAENASTRPAASLARPRSFTCRRAAAHGFVPVLAYRPVNSADSAPGSPPARRRNQRTVPANGHGPPGLDVDQQGPAAPSLAQFELIHAQRRR